MRKSEYRTASVLFKNEEAGILKETKNGYLFAYSKEFIEKNISISISLPVRKEFYESERLFSFFQVLIPEGWYLDLVCAKLKIDKNDTFGVLLSTCKDCIGAVSIKEIL